MKKALVSFLTAALFVPSLTLAFAPPSEGCSHYITDLATGSGGYEGKACDLQTLSALGANTNLTTVERVDALKMLVSLLMAQIAQIVESKKSSVPGSTCFVPVNDLYLERTDAQTNGEVSKLQLWLKAEGYFPDATGTGYYGEKTAAAVVKWQKAHGLDFVTVKSGVGKMTRAKMQEACGKTVVAQCAKYDDPPVITAIMPTSGPVGTRIMVNGCNFLGFEGDKNLWIKNAGGVKGVLYGERDASNTILRATIPAQLCQQDTSYSGFDCPALLELTPGVYSIQASGWGGLSNPMNFTIVSLEGTGFRAESEVPMTTYTHSTPGSGAQVLETEPVFGEGVVIDPSNTILPTNIVEFTKGNYTNPSYYVVKMSYLNTSAIHVSQFTGETGFVYLACTGTRKIGANITFGKGLYYQCNPGAIGMITKDGRSIGSGMWAAN